MKPIQVVAAYMKKSWEILCAQYPDKDETAFMWGFPGGKHEAGETNEEASGM
jgi:8-oxo-dGTP pyrophosphatase MutT (NUDIX family)